MNEIIPAIMPKNYEDLKNKISLVRGLVPIVQIDICDGVFVKNRTWPFEGGDFDQYFTKMMAEEEGMPFWEDIDFELDLMVADAVSNFDHFLKMGPKRMIFHLEATGDLMEFKNFLEGIDVYIRDTIQFGVAINPMTPIEKIFPIVNLVDFIQCMGIDREGFQGQPFDEKDLDHIVNLKKKYPDLIISVDGGVDFNTAPRILEAGADRLVIGSAIFKSEDIRGTIQEFRMIGK